MTEKIEKKNTHFTVFRKEVPKVIHIFAKHK